MQSSAVADAVICSNRQEVRSATDAYLKKKGISNVVQSGDGNECAEAVERFPKGLLVIDWEIGELEAVKVLQKSKSAAGGISRPTLLISASVTAELVAIAAEYGVSQIFTDEVNEKSLGAKLGQILILSTQSSDFQKVMTDVIAKRERGEDEQTIPILAQLVEKNPKDLRAKAEYAESLIAADRWDEVEEVLGDVEESQPPFLRGMQLKARVLMKKGDFEGAQALLAKAELFNPHDTSRLCELGNILINLDRAEEAEQKFQAALDIDPSLKEATQGKGNALLIQGQVNDALGLLKDVTSNRELASMFNTSAILNMRQGRHDQGMNLYLSAVKALGKNPKLQARLMFNMGLGYRRWNKPEKAASCFRKALEYDPTFSKAEEQAISVTSAALPAAAGDEPPPKSPSPFGFDESGDDFDDFDEDDLEEAIEYK